MEDPKYFKKEIYIKEVPRYVEQKKEFAEVVEANNSMIKKCCYATASSICFCLAFMGLKSADSFTRLEPDTVVYQQRQETVIVKAMEKEEAWRDVTPSFQEMLPVARKIFKNQVKSNLVEYLKQKQGMDLKHNAPARQL